MSRYPVKARPASSVLLVRNRDELEVLMVQRPARGFFGGLMVFPGGAVESCDLHRNGAHDDLHHRMAGLRETAEEVGVAVTPGGHVPAPPLRGEPLVSAVGESDGWGLDRMTLVSRWITPKIAPTRFDTRFYLVSIDGDPPIVLDRNELVGHTWATPAEALRRSLSGEWSMILPTISHLRWLARRTSYEDAIRSAEGTDGSTIIEPTDRDDEFMVRYRGEDHDED